jgi:FHS family Na+ dependent glucose MFS transporter 1
MLLIDAAGCMLALVVMTIFNTNMVVLWVFSIVLGLSLASQFPTTIALPATHMNMQVTGMMTSTMVFFAAIGEMVIPLLMTGATASQLGPGSLFYLLVLVTLIATITYIVLLFGFSREKSKLSK